MSIEPWKLGVARMGEIPEDMTDEELLAIAVPLGERILREERPLRRATPSRPPLEPDSGTRELSPRAKKVLMQCGLLGPDEK